MPMDPVANPVVLQRADPCVLRHDGQYYFTGSHPRYDRIVLRRAERLADLQGAPEVTIWNKHAEGPQSNLHRVPARRPRGSPVAPGRRLTRGAVRARLMAAAPYCAPTVGGKPGGGCRWFRASAVTAGPLAQLAELRTFNP